MKLADLLVKPMHRLIQYPLLLKAILKKSDDEEAIDKLLTVASGITSKAPTVLVSRSPFFLGRARRVLFESRQFDGRS